jgi:hypothetical protein
MMRRLVLGMAALLVVGAQPTLGQEAPPSEFRHSDPDWAHLKSIYDGTRHVIGGYPIDAEFGSNGTALVQGVVGAVQIPPELKAPNHSAGVAGYARTESKEHMAVGIHGFGGAMQDGGSAEGGHFLVTNCGKQGCPPTGGADINALYIVEADINLMKLASGDAPSGSAFGLIVFGAGNVQPKGAFQAIRVDSPGVFHDPIIAWKEGVFTADGAADVAINVGTTKPGLHPAPSQPIALRSTAEVGHSVVSTIRADEDGAISLSPASGRLRLNGGSITLARSEPPPSSSAPCEVGQMQWDAGFVYVCVTPNKWRRAALTDW